MVSLTGLMCERMTGSIRFSLGSCAVRSSWLSEARTVAIGRLNKGTAGGCVKFARVIWRDSDRNVCLANIEHMTTTVYLESVRC